MDRDNIKKAAELIINADAILIGAGAGMGVDSGLPDFRGTEGFWKAYPVAKSLNLNFQQMANPANFIFNPELAWGFYGHRYHLYKSTKPHMGFNILKKWVDNKKYGGYVYTSNVDGQFQKSHFSEQNIVECHGSIHYLQCSDSCTHDIWPADNLKIEIDINTLKAVSGIPRCRNCGSIARPNILMFGDYNWNSDRCDEQEAPYRDWVQEVKQEKLIIIEIGAGTHIPTIRYECTSHSKPVIRINPTQCDVSQGIGIKLGALEAIESIDKIM